MILFGQTLFHAREAKIDHRKTPYEHVDTKRHSHFVHLLVLFSPSPMSAITAHLPNIATHFCWRGVVKPAF